VNDADEFAPLRGRRVALLETREADRLAAMLRGQGAEVVACPAVAIAELAHPEAAFAWLRRMVDAPFDDLILLTGEGVSRLHALAVRAGIEAGFLASLRRSRTIGRGPKPVRALRALGLAPQLRADPATTDGIIALLSATDLNGRRVGVQLYPDAPDTRLTDFLAAAGAVADAVVPYAYASQAADEAIAALIEAIATSEIDAVAFTSASQVRRLFRVAERSGRDAHLRAGLHRTAIAAIGPVVAAELQRRGFVPGIMPSGSYFMKPLVSALVAAFRGG